MWIYSSQLTLLLVSMVTLLLLVWLVTGSNPMREIGTAIRAMRQDIRFLISLILAFGMLLVDAIETYFEPGLARSVPWDFTPELAKYGTDLIRLLQRAEWAPLTHLLTFVYIVAFPLLMLACFAAYAARHDLVALKRLLIATFLNYLTALPFYLLLPVREAWTAAEGVRFLIPTVYTAFEEQYRTFSALDNSFPSLHTSLVLTYTLIACRNGYRRMAGVMTVMSGLVMMSTLYLGVHWVFDMVAGAGVAVMASGWLPGFAPAPTLAAHEQ
ncbi:MAG TPA: phosphatase PAP2 family protein [Symbiobacteriaceae bacterium]|nr:phosphatase PAP2 family protein [Symbiobacteriaceae bacterium]